MCTCTSCDEPLCSWCNARANEAVAARNEEWDGEEDPRQYPLPAPKENS